MVRGSSSKQANKIKGSYIHNYKGSKENLLKVTPCFFSAFYCLAEKYSEKDRWIGDKAIGSFFLGLLSVTVADPDIQIRGAPGPSPRSATGALIKSDKSPLQNSYIFLDRSLSKILFRVRIPRGTPLYYGHICMFPPERYGFWSFLV